MFRSFYQEQFVASLRVSQMVAWFPSLSKVSAIGAQPSSSVPSELGALRSPIPLEVID